MDGQVVVSQQALQPVLLIQLLALSAHPCCEYPTVHVHDVLLLHEAAAHCCGVHELAHDGVAQLATEHSVPSLQVSLP